MKRKIRYILLASVLCLSFLTSTSCDMLVSSLASSVDDGAAPEDNTPEIDYVELINGITESAMLFNVKVVSKHVTRVNTYNQTTEIFQGSGAIYKETDDHYYVITNDHVVACNEEVCSDKFEVYDAYGNFYYGQLLSNDARYDLAVLRFEKGDAELSVASIAKVNVATGDNVISIGTPKGQTNAITLGIVSGYREVEPGDGEDKIEFEVMVHTCPLKQGSSGGVVLNYDCELVGVNYAVAKSASVDIEIGLAIPLDKVLEFVNSNKTTAITEN